MTIPLFDVKIIKRELKVVYDLARAFRDSLRRSVEKESRDLTNRIIRHSLSVPFSSIYGKDRYSIGKRTGRLVEGTRPLGPMVLGPRVLGGTVIGSGVFYTHVHVGESEEPPTVITPKRGRYLVVPLRAAMDSKGVLRSEYNVGSLRNIPDLFAKDGILWKRTGPKGKGKLPLFLLRKKVVIEKAVLTDMIAAANEKLVRDNIEADMVRTIGRIRGVRVY